MTRACLASLFALLPAIAGANIIPTSTTLAGPGEYVWTYDLQSLLDRDVASSLSSTAGAVTYGNLAFGSFVTVYGFAGYIPGSCTAPAGWVCTAQKVGMTPDAIVPGDDASLPNLTWVYTTWPTLDGHPANREPGLFGATSSFGTSTLVSYATSGIKDSGAYPGTIADHVGTTRGPSDKLAPEPGSLALASLALALMGGMLPKRQAMR